MASPSFGDPVNAQNQKLTGEQAKCKPGKKGCDGVLYACFSGAKRQYYVKTSSECNVEADEKVCLKDEAGDCLVDENGEIMYDRPRGVSYYVNVIINVVLGVIGVVSVVMIIIGGIQYATSSGDPQKAQKAQKTIIFSIAGLVIALLAFAIVNFVLTNVFK